MEKVELDIFVIEGPAGSGKSTLIPKVADWNPIERMTFQPDIRNYDGTAGVGLSQLKDYAANLAIFEMLVNTKYKIFVLDRWTLSQVVYGAIRRKQPTVYPTEVNRSLEWAGTNMVLQFYEYQARLGADPNSHTLVPFFHFLILLPSEERLVRNRNLSGRPFPFSVQQELICWRQVATHMKQYHTDQVRIYTLDTDEEYDRLLESATVQVFGVKYHASQLSLHIP